MTSLKDVPSRIDAYRGHIIRSPTGDLSPAAPDNDDGPPEKSRSVRLRRWPGSTVSRHGQAAEPHGPSAVTALER